MPNINEDVKKEGLIEDFDLSTLDKNDNIVLDLSAKKSSDVSLESWIGFDSELKTSDGSILLSKARLENVFKSLKASGKAGGGIYDFSKNILDIDDVSASITDSGKILIEKTYREDGKDRTLVGVFDKENKIFASAEAVVSKGQINYIPIDSLEASKSLMFSALVAERVSSSRKIKRSNEQLFRDFYNSETKTITNSNNQDAVGKFVTAVADIGKAVFNQYFTTTKKTDDGSRIFQGYTFDTINANLTKEAIDSLSKSTKIYGKKEADYFQNVETPLEINNDPRTIRELLAAYDVNLYDEKGVRKSQEEIDKYLKSPEYKERLERLEERSNIFPEWAADLARRTFRTIIANRRTKAAGHSFTPYRQEIYSPPGTGKSYNAETIALLIGVHYASKPCYQSTSADELGYREAIINGRSIKIPSVVMETFKYGGLCVLDEFPNIHNVEAINVLTDAIKQGYYTDADGVRQQVHPDAAIYFVGNLGVSGTKQPSERITNSSDHVFFVRPYNADEMFGIIKFALTEQIETLDPEVAAFFNDKEWVEAVKCMCDIIDEINTDVYNDSKFLPLRNRNKKPYIDIRHAPGFLSLVLHNAKVVYNEGGPYDWKSSFLKLITASDNNRLFPSDDKSAEVRALTSKLVGKVSTANISSGKSLEQLLKRSSINAEAGVF